VIKDFWKTDFETHMPEREQRERTLSTLNKIGAFISDPAIRNSIGQSKTAIDLKDMMDNRKILLGKLPQGQLGIEKSRLIGALLRSHIHLTALSRTDDRTPFHICADECHNFGNNTLIEMLSGIRKFGISLVLAHQYLDQLDKPFSSALIGTVGTTVSFRLGIRDANLLTEEFELNRNHMALHELEPFTAHMRSNGEATPSKCRPLTTRFTPRPRSASGTGAGANLPPQEPWLRAELRGSLRTPLDTYAHFLSFFDSDI